MLRFINFKKSFGSFTVLQIEDLHVEPGVYWIKGTNGSGKTTLLKATAGIIDFKGDVVIDGRISIKTAPLAYRRLVNFAEAEPLFPDFISGTEMIQMFSYTKGGSAEQAEKYIDSMKMSEYIDEPLGKDSSGMLKKLSLVLAFVGHPKLILLDEPLITIDADSLRIVSEWIKTKHLEENVSFFLSSHQPVEMSYGLKLQELFVTHHTLQPGC